MDKIRVIGGQRIVGKIQIAGAKNAALPIMCASLLTSDILVISGLPHLSDIATMCNLLMSLGVSFSVDGSSFLSGSGKTILLNAAEISNKTAHYDIVRKMRASIWVLGPLLSRFGEARVSLPGGCAIGTRPIDMHLAALEAMGATIFLEDGYVHAKCAGRLKGAEIYFDKISVGATINTLMAATLADGKTILHNVAREPEVNDLVNCLLSMGANIENLDNGTMVIEGVEKLHGAHHHIIADRIEAGTYAIAAAITGGDVELLNIDASMLESMSEKLISTGVKVTAIPGGMRVVGSGERIIANDITTMPYPGFPTDLQAQFMALMAISNGASLISETLYENRFMHVPELMRMGANIKINGNTALIRGVRKLKGAQVMATDLRASVSLVLAGLVAEGETVINRVYHIDRGYEHLEAKLAACGANICRLQ
jgi:UDP-N-acetylglucosamine 1-carboxyvinyltransferase